MSLPSQDNFGLSFRIKSDPFRASGGILDRLTSRPGHFVVRLDGKADREQGKKTPQKFENKSRNRKGNFPSP